MCGGADQAVALLYALQSPGVQVTGIIASGSRRQQCLSLAQKVLSFSQTREEIPIAAGASHPLLGGLTEPGTSDGEEGVRLLVEKADEANGELTVVTLGSLTTLAKAAASDPGLAKKLKQIVVRGGAIRVPGDVTPVAEANFYADPEAAAFVLAAGLPLVLVPLDATGDLRLTQDQQQRMAKLAKTNGMVAAFDDHWHPGERLDAWGAMLAALHPERIQIQTMKLAIECKSALSAGAVLADLRAKPSVGTDTDVCLAVDAAASSHWLEAVFFGEGNR